MIRSFLLNKYLSIEFLKIVINASIVFFCLGFIMNIFEEINFEKQQLGYLIYSHFTG